MAACPNQNIKVRIFARSGYSSEDWGLTGDSGTFLAESVREWLMSSVRRTCALGGIPGDV